MAKGAFIGVNGVARKIRKGYIGVDGVARKIRKAYIGVDGKARLFYSGVGKITYQKTIDRGSAMATDFIPGTIGDYAVMGTGTLTTYDGYTYNSNYMFCYNSNFTYTMKEAPARYSYAVANSGNYMLVAGGKNVYDYYFTEVKAYNASLTVSDANSLPQNYIGGLGVSAGNTALFLGPGTNINAYNGLTRTSYENGMYLHTTRSDVTSFGDLAVVVPGGGNLDHAYSTDVYYYNSSVTRSKATTGLLYAVTGAAATTNGSHLLVGGGEYDYGYDAEGNPISYRTSHVNAFTKDFVRHSTSFSIVPGGNRYYLHGFDIDGYGVFIVDRYDGYPTIEAFDESLVRTIVNSNIHISGIYEYEYITNKKMFMIMSRNPNPQGDQGMEMLCYNLVEQN